MESGGSGGTERIVDEVEKEVAEETIAVGASATDDASTNRLVKQFDASICFVSLVFFFSAFHNEKDFLISVEF